MRREQRSLRSKSHNQYAAAHPLSIGARFCVFPFALCHAAVPARENVCFPSLAANMKAVRPGYFYTLLTRRERRDTNAQHL